MLVNGATVDDRLVLELAGAIPDRALAHKLQAACRFRSAVVNLNSTERAVVLAALDSSSTAGLGELRAQLVQHPAWRAPPRLV